MAAKKPQKKTKSMHENAKASLTVRYRAKCKKGDLTSAWRATLEEAQDDALDHQDAKPSHQVQITTEQSMTMDFN